MQVIERVHSLRIPFKIQTSPTTSLDRFVNCFIVFGEGVVLIDAGVAGSETIIDAYLKGYGSSIEDVDLIIQTHAHPDHIGATKAIKQVSGCEVAIHGAEREWLENTEAQFAARPVPGFHTLVGGSAHVDFVLKDGDKIDLGKGQSLKVIHTPGHSPGSSCFLYQAGKVLFCGDAVPLPGEMPIYDDAAQTLGSVRRLLGIRGVEHLLSAWDAQRSGNDVQSVMKRGFDYLSSIQAAVDAIEQDRPGLSDEEMCREALRKAGLEHIPPLPLVQRSIRSNRAAWKQRN